MTLEEAKTFLIGKEVLDVYNKPYKVSDLRRFSNGTVSVYFEGINYWNNIGIVRLKENNKFLDEIVKID